MLERWKDVVGFSDYVVSNYGEVYCSRTGRILRQTPVQYGMLTVGLWRDNKQHRRSVATLVATAFLDKQRDDFNTPIHLDGDRSNCRVDNLAWRPRHFAVRYHLERKNPRFPKWKRPFELVQTEEEFDSIGVAAVKYGMLESDIFIGLTNGTSVFPMWVHFRYLED